MALSAANAQPIPARLLAMSVAVAVWVAFSPHGRTDEIAPGVLLTPKAVRAAVAKNRELLVRIETFGGTQTHRAPTTGVIVSESGHILTSSYQLEEAPPVITCILSDGKRRIAKLLGRDETRRLCLLKVEAADLPTPTIAPRASLRVGQFAIAVGAAIKADQPTVSLGIVSALRRISGRAVQVDCNTGPANYGGLILDIEGNAIGICTPLHPQASEGASGVEWYDSGIGFAAPLEELAPVIAAMQRGETIRYGYLGIEAKETPQGVEAAAVAENSPAAQANIRPGDRILQVAGREVATTAELRLALSALAAGDEIAILLQRKSENIRTTAVLAPRPVAKDPLATPR